MTKKLDAGIALASTNELNIAVDVGRSSVKIMTKAGELSFPFLVATKRSLTADYYAPGEKIQKWAEVNGEEFFFGEEATLLGETVIQHTEGDAFREMSVKATVFAVAYAMLSAKTFYPKANVALNLTFDNHYQKEMYSKALKGKHKVHFMREDQTVEFSIERVFVLYQGYSGLLSVAMDTAFKVKQDYMEGEGVVIDVGRQTIDFLFVDRMVVKKGISKDFGTFKVYDRVADLLKKKYDIVKEAYEIEEYITRGKAINQLDTGVKVQVQPLVKDAVAHYFGDVTTHFSSFLSKETPDYLLLLGGGALIYGPFFQAKYKLVEIPENPQFSNAAGMLRFLDKAAR